MSFHDPLTGETYEMADILPTAPPWEPGARAALLAKVEPGAQIPDPNWPVVEIPTVAAPPTPYELPPDGRSMVWDAQDLYDAIDQLASYETLRPHIEVFPPGVVDLDDWR